MGGPCCSHRWAEPWRGWGSELCGAFQADRTTRAKLLRRKGPHQGKEGPRKAQLWAGADGGGGQWGEDQSHAGRSVPCQPLIGLGLSLPSWAGTLIVSGEPHSANGCLKIVRIWESKHCRWFLLYSEPQSWELLKKKNPLLFISMYSKSDGDPVTSVLLISCN